MSLFRQYFGNSFSMTETTLKSFSLSIKSAPVSASFSTILRAILSLTPRSRIPFLQGIKNMDIFQNNKCNFSFLEIALILLSLSHKLDTQVYSSFLFSKIFFCSPSLHDSSSAPWLHMVFTTQYNICFSNYVSDYFRTYILHLQSCVSLVCCFNQNQICNSTNENKRNLSSTCIEKMTGKWLIWTKLFAPCFFTYLKLNWQ